MANLTAIANRVSTDQYSGCAFQVVEDGALVRCGEPVRDGDADGACYKELVNGLNGSWVEARVPRDHCLCPTHFAFVTDCLLPGITMRREGSAPTMVSVKSIKELFPKVTRKPTRPAAKPRQEPTDTPAVIVADNPYDNAVVAKLRSQIAELQSEVRAWKQLRRSVA
jgi:hypothetical protein